MKKYIWFLLGVLLSLSMPGLSYSAECWESNAITRNYGDYSVSGQSVNAYSGGNGTGEIQYYLLGAVISNPTYSTYCTEPVEPAPYYSTGSVFIITNTDPAPSTACGYNGALGRYNDGWKQRWWKYSASLDTCPVQPTCSDGIQNQDETSIDCGGVCGSCEPAECSDGLVSGDEEGIDCGGSCLADCVTFCPTDYTLISGTCYSPETEMINGNCPEGTTGWNITDGTCITSVPVEYAFPDYTYTEPEEFGWVFNDENSPWVSNVSESTVDNGDGTSTTTTTTTTTVNNYDGTTTNNTSTSTTITNNTTGALVSESSSGTETISTPSNSVPVGEASYDGTLTEGVDYESESSFGDMLDSFADGVSGVGTTLGDSGLVTSDPVCSVSFESFNASMIDLSFCGEPYDTWFSVFGALIVAFSGLYAVFIVFRR